MQPDLPFQLATRIHFALRRLYGVDVSVATLLRGGEAAREAFWVCEASGQAELAQLARSLRDLQVREASARRRALRRAAPAPAPEHAPQDAVWARNTSGFGASGFGASAAMKAEPAASTRSGWFAAVPWRRRKPAADRSPR